MAAAYAVFITNLWKQARVTTDQVNQLVTLGRLTQKEADEILATEQN